MQTGDPLAFKKVKYNLIIIGDDTNIKNSDGNQLFSYFT